MKYGFLFALQAASLTGLAVMYRGWGWLLLWPAVSFAVMAAGYLGAGLRVTGKRDDGTLAWWAMLLLLPYLLFGWSVWYVLRWLSRKPAYHRLSGGVLIGRRLLPGELPPEVETVVDLTSEFVEPAAIRNHTQYIAAPMLDAGVAAPQQLAELARRIAAERSTVYIHCAQGRGRTGLVASLVLLAKGEAADADDALQQVQAARPGVRLGSVQMKSLRAAAELLRASSPKEQQSY